MRVGRSPQRSPVAPIHHSRGLPAMRAHSYRVLWLAATIGCAACMHRDSPGASTDAAAIAYVRTRYSQHFRNGQGFSVDTLRARREWFTPCFYSLLLSDMDGAAARGDIGVLDWDPFTSAQDDANGFRVVDARRSHDTVLVRVAVLFDYPPPGSTRNVTVAVAPVDTAWRIANLVTPEFDLARGIDSALREDASRARKPYTSCVVR